MVLAGLVGAVCIVIFAAAVVLPRQIVAHEASRHDNLRDAALAWREAFLVDPAQAASLEIWEARITSGEEAFLLVRPLGEEAAWWERWLPRPDAEVGTPLRKKASFQWRPALRRTMGQRTNLSGRKAVLGRGTVVVDLGRGAPGEASTASERRSPVIVVGADSSPEGDPTDAELGPGPACVPLLARDHERTRSGRLAVLPAPGTGEVAKAGLVWLHLSGDQASVWRSPECPAEEASLVGSLTLGPGNPDRHALLTFGEDPDESTGRVEPRVLVAEHGGYSLWKLETGRKEFARQGNIGPEGLTPSSDGDVPLLPQREVLDSPARPGPAQTAVRARQNGRFRYLVPGETKGRLVFADCSEPKWSQYKVTHVDSSLSSDGCASLPQPGKLIDRAQCRNWPKDHTWTTQKPTCIWPSRGYCPLLVEKASCETATSR